MMSPKLCLVVGQFASRDRLRLYQGSLLVMKAFGLPFTLVKSAQRSLQVNTLAMSTAGELTIDTETLVSRITPFELPLYSYKGSASVPSISRYRKSAVLVPLFITQDGVPHVLLTQRSSTLHHHAGDVAFPGGMRDDGDATEVETALREAEEEVGLQRHHVRIVSRLPPRVSRHKVVIFPVVGIIPKDFVAKPNEAEVDSVFTIPLERFLSDRNHEGHTFSLGPGKKGMFHVFTDTVDGRVYKTWGLTANIITEVAIAILQRKADFMFDAQVDVTPENPFSAQLLYLKQFHNFSTSHL